jgi:glycosyltransferase involved in cell wall biosynthesis
MRIGVLLHDLAGGGAEPVARSWAAGLADLGHEVVFLLYGRAATDHGGDGVRAVAFPGRGGSTASRWVLLPWWVRREAGRRNLHVVLSVLDFSNVVALLAGLGGSRAVVISEHAVPSLLWRHRGASGVIKGVAARLLYRRADAVVAVSHAVATDVRVALSVPADRLVVLSNPVVRPPATQAPGAPAAPERRVLLVGRCAPEKRLDRALEVVRELRSRGLDWGCCVLGDGPLRPSLERMAQTWGLPVEFAGWVSPWQVRARPGDVLLLTSDLEGFGNVLVEAAAAGIPAVAPSPALGVADAVLPGVTAVLSPTNRVEDLADAVVQAAGLQVSSPAVETWLQRFTPDRAARVLEGVLGRAVDARRSTTRVVTHVGHSPDAQGGVASVLRTYRDADVAGWRTRFVTSYVAGSPAWSAGPAARALLHLLLLPQARLGVVHAHLSFGGSFVREGGLAVLASWRSPVVVTLHGSNFARFAAEHPRVVATVLRRAAAVVLLNDAHRELLPPDVRDRVVLVPNTVVSDDRAPVPPPPAARAVFAGELSRRKGLDVLLEAWPRVRAVLPDAELVVAGPVGDIEPSPHAGVHWTGAVDNSQVRTLLREARVAVLPSRREVMPMFVLEAMSAGRAVVATPVGALADTVGDGGVVVPVEGRRGPRHRPDRPARTWRTRRGPGRCSAGSLRGPLRPRAGHDPAGRGLPAVRRRAGRRTTGAPKVATA